MRSHGTTARRRARTWWALLGSVALAIAIPVPGGHTVAGGSPAVAEPGPGGAQGTVPGALAAAREAWWRGDVRMTRAWLALASREVDAAIEGESGTWLQGNALQLLDVLEFYALFASGSRPDLDRQYEAIVHDLQRIDSLNRAPVQPHGVGDDIVQYDLISRLVRRIGDLEIRYDLITQQITGIGDVRIAYDLISRMPVRIGDIEIHYDLIDGSIRSIADVDTGRFGSR